MKIVCRKRKYDFKKYLKKVLTQGLGFGIINERSRERGTLTKQIT